jgi:predicted translin family RNA/ssDNA-binding protein
MKEKILTLLREMTSDSKSASYKAEKELCDILTGVINKLHTIEKTVGSYIRNYPEKIESIDDEYYLYDELPIEIECNDGDFYFKTEWLDINLQEYFEKLKKSEIGSIKHTIERVEYSLGKHREEIKRIEELKFEDLKI